MDHKITYLKKLLISWQKSVLGFLPDLVLGVLVLILFVLAAKFARKYTIRFYARTFKQESTLAHIVSSLIYFFFLFSGIILSLQILGLEKFLTKLLTGAGIVGIIAGFAFKDVASNMFASILLKIQNPFKRGEWVEINDSYGSVVDIGWITTAIKTVQGQKVYIPNQVVYNSNFTNYSSYGKRRVVFESGVSYGDDLDLVKRCALEEVQKIHNLLPDEDIDFFFTSIGGYSYNFQLRFWIKFTANKDYREAMSEIIMKIKRRFEKEDISLAYQVMTLDFGVKGGVNIYDNPLHIITDHAAPERVTPLPVHPPTTPPAATPLTTPPTSPSNGATSDESSAPQEEVARSTEGSATESSGSISSPKSTE